MKIERSNSHGRFSEAEIRAAVAETKRRKSNPAYVAAEAKRVAEAERRAKSKGTRFPELAGRGTKPGLSIAEHRLRLIEKSAR